jgi:Notch-like protein
MPLLAKFKKIKTIRIKNSCGYNEISNQIIKLSAPFIISPLTYICNAVLGTGVFTDRLKYATVKPIFKKGNTQEISNYRPISLLTSFSKIMEKPFMPDSLLTLRRIIFWYVNNMDLVLIPQLRKLPSH